MSLTGPSRTIVVEPLVVPQRAPAPAAPPAPAPGPARTAEPPEREPART